MRLKLLRALQLATLTLVKTGTGTPEKVVVFGVGNGGQRLTVQPDKNLVTASYCGLYNDPNGWETSFKILRDYAVPDAKRVLGQ